MDIDEKNEIFKKIVIFLFEKWTQNFQNIWIVVADFPPLDPPCFYDLSAFGGSESIQFELAPKLSQRWN